MNVGQVSVSALPPGRSVSLIRSHPQFLFEALGLPPCPAVISHPLSFFRCCLLFISSSAKLWPLSHSKQAD